MARAEEVMHQVEQGAENMEKLRRKLEELMQPVDGVAEARGRGRSVASRCQLVEAIQQLGYLPRQGKNSTIEEKHLAVRLIRARKADLRKAWEVRKLQQRAAVRIAKAEEMMQEVRGFGRYPMESRQDVRERQRADKLRKARKAKRFSPAQEAELQVLQQAARDARAGARIAQVEELMQQVRDFGRYPKASKHVVSRERRLAQNLRKARKEKLLSPEQESELQVLQQAEMDSRVAARISEAQTSGSYGEVRGGVGEQDYPAPHGQAERVQWEVRGHPTRQGQEE